MTKNAYIIWVYGCVTQLDAIMEQQDRETAELRAIDPRAADLLSNVRAEERKLRDYLKSRSELSK